MTATTDIFGNKENKIRVISKLVGSFVGTQERRAARHTLQNKLTESLVRLLSHRVTFNVFQAIKMGQGYV